jgi:creatinine amidohydrolase
MSGNTVKRPHVPTTGYLETNMTDKVNYLELRPDEFRERVGKRPVAYLPLGTIEWHGRQNPLGGDALISTALFERAARRFGGIVFPPLFLGPDRIRQEQDGSMLQGMDYAEDVTVPPQQLYGSCYWVNTGLFMQIVEAVIAQAARAGFKCLVADGHGPSRGHFCANAEGWEKQYGIRLIGARYNMEDGWATQMDHAARNETSLLMAAHPDLVDLDVLSTDRSDWPLGVGGEDPRDSTAQYGEELIEKSLTLIGRAFDRLSV